MSCQRTSVCLRDRDIRIAQPAIVNLLTLSLSNRNHYIASVHRRQLAN